MNARTLQRAAVGIAALGLLAPPGFVAAAEPATPQPAGVAAAPAHIADVALAAGGMLRGQVLDSSGLGVAGVTVTVRQHDTALAQATSDASGTFTIPGMQGGIFQLTTQYSEGSYRFWAPTTSPPGARPAALVVHDAELVRGQTKLTRFLSRPIVIAGLVATAIAVPVAIHAIETNRPSGS